MTVDISLAKHRAESNSNLGTVMGFKGATRVFDTRNWEYVQLSSSTRYTTAAYAAVEARGGWKLVISAMRGVAIIAT